MISYPGLGILHDLLEVTIVAGIVTVIPAAQKSYDLVLVLRDLPVSPVIVEAVILGEAGGLVIEGSPFRSCESGERGTVQLRN